jgi:hypothetical protein
MKWLRNRKLTKREWRFPPFTLLLTGLSGGEWFFGLMRFGRDRSELVEKRAPYYSYQLEYGPGYEETGWMPPRPIKRKRIV